MCAIGSISVDSTNCTWKIFNKKQCYVADMDYVLRPTIVAFALNMSRHFFLSLFPKQYSITTIYMVVVLEVT
jgi:hypothetical protein